MSQRMLVAEHPVALSRTRPADAPPRDRSWIGRLVAWQDRWRQRRDLQSLSAERLADIGLTPAEVPGWDC